MPPEIIKGIDLLVYWWYNSSHNGGIRPMTAFALLSELHRLHHSQLDRDDLHIICDDGDWSEEQINHYINTWRGHNVLYPERYLDGEEEREGIWR